MTRDKLMDDFRKKLDEALEEWAQRYATTFADLSAEEIAAAMIDELQDVAPFRPSVLRIAVDKERQAIAHARRDVGRRVQVDIDAYSAWYNRINPGTMPSTMPDTNILVAGKWRTDDLLECNEEGRRWVFPIPQRFILRMLDEDAKG